MKNFQPDLVLIDGSSYLFRAFYALPSLANSAGMPTGAVYGVISMVKKLRVDYPASYFGVVFDAGKKSFRNEIYAQYKANRGETPDDLKPQFKPLLQIIKAMGLPLVMEEGVEADDVIASFVKEAKKRGMKTLISTGDKDIAQLVDNQVVLVNTMTDRFLDEQGVLEKFGVRPSQMVDYLALIGDTSDNIPGVSKVGPKTAAKWLQQYDNLDNLIAHSEEIKGKVGEHLRGGLDQLRLSKQLIILRSDLNLKESLEDLKPTGQNKAELIELFKQLEFRHWLSELLDESKANNDEDYETVLTQAQWEVWLSRLKQAPCFAFDTETDSLKAIDANLVGLSFSIEKGKAAYVPFSHDYEGAPDQLNRKRVLEQLQPLLVSGKTTLIGQHIKFDIKVLRNYGIHIDTRLHDTQVASYILNSSSSRHSLDGLALKYLGRQTISYEEVAGKGTKQVTFNQVDLEKATPYAAEDADVTLQLHHTLSSLLNKDKRLKSVYETIELPLIPVLADMEYTGVLVDAAKLKQQSEEIAKRLLELEKTVHALAGSAFNLSSTKQLQEILYEKLKLPILSKTPKGVPSTAEAVLQELAREHDLPKFLLEYRSLSKLKSTYTDSLPKEISARTGRVHTSYQQTVASTGRLSSTHPNLQNIPIRTEEGRRIRQAFVAPRGYKILTSDYSQIELRIMAHLTQDENLLRAFESGLDIHTATAAEVFNIAMENVSNEQRRSAKAINFGIIYGMSAFGLAKQLGIPTHLAKKYIELYFSRYPGIEDYMNATKALALKQGYVETLFGRRLHLPDIQSSNMMRRKAMERAAINGPMQGTAADIIKLAMIQMHEWLKKEEVDAKMIMQVHDELVFEVLEKDVQKAKTQIEHIMMHAVSLRVPLQVSTGVGDNWDEAH